MQRYFVNLFPRGDSPTIELIANIGLARDAAHRAGLPVVYSAQPGRMSRRDRGLLLDVWGPGMTDAPGDRDIIPELVPEPRDVVVTKRRYSAFFGTPLAGLLSSLGRDQLIVCGVFAHLGCLLTAADAFSHDLETFLLADAVADFTLDDHLMALDYAAQRCAVTMTTDRMMSHVAVPARPARPGK
jgi:bifunctional isochorismate lyase/aryl carrier protein